MLTLHDLSPSYAVGDEINGVSLPLTLRGRGMHAAGMHHAYRGTVETVPHVGTRYHTQHGSAPEHTRMVTSTDGMTALKQSTIMVLCSMWVTALFTTTMHP